MNQQTTGTTTEETETTTDTTTTETTSEVDVKTNPDIAKLQEQVTNLTTALKQEREQNKAFKQKEADEAEKKKLEKGKHEEVIAEQKKTIEELTVKATAYDELQAKIAKQQSDEYESILTTLPEDIKTKYLPTLEQLDMEGRIGLLKNITSDIKKDDFSNKPKEEGDAKPDNFELLKEKVKSGKATPTERSEYLNLLRKPQ